MPEKIIAFITPASSQRDLKRYLAELTEPLRGMSEVFYIRPDRAPFQPWEIPDFIKVYRHPAKLGFGDFLRLGFLRATESRYDSLLVLDPDFPLSAEELLNFLSQKRESNNPQIFYANPAPPVFPRCLKWNGRTFGHSLIESLLGLKLPPLSSPARLIPVEILRRIPFLYNSVDRIYNLDFAIQVALSKNDLRETDLHPNLKEGKSIAWFPLRGLFRLSLLKSLAKFRLMQFELFYDPKFDISRPEYMVKEAPTGIHHFMRQVPVAPGSNLLDVGGGVGAAISSSHAKTGVNVTCIDILAENKIGPVSFHRVDLDLPWKNQMPGLKFDTIFALDIIEHLKSPETGLGEMFKILSRKGTLYASTGNVSFWTVRIMLLFGQFNYGRRGILDLTHRRLFTIGSFRRILRNSGFMVENIYAFGPPIADFSKKSGKWIKLTDLIFFKLARAFPGLFAFQFVAVCKRIDSPSDLLSDVYEGD